MSESEKEDVLVSVATSSSSCPVVGPEDRCSPSPSIGVGSGVSRSSECGDRESREKERECTDKTREQRKQTGSENGQKEKLLSLPLL